jgi:hypothetical protein
MLGFYSGQGLVRARRRGRGTSSPPQLGQAAFIARVQSPQKVHS